MIGLILILFFTGRVNSEMQSMQYHMHVSRKSRSNSVPMETGYVYSQVNDGPGTLATFANGASGYNSVAAGEPNVAKHSDTMTFKYGDSYNVNYSDKTTNRNDFPIGKYSDTNKENFSERTTKYRSTPSIKYSATSKDKYGDRLTKYNDSLDKYNDKLSRYRDTSVPKVKEHSTHINLLTANNSGPPVIQSHVSKTEPSKSDYSVDYAIAKSQAEANYDSKFLPSKIKSDALYERLKSLMHYSPPETTSTYNYASLSDFHVDDNDIRSGSRSYDNWPYFYHSPYEYEHIKIDSDIQKAKDKRYAVDTARKIIPVHEEQEGDMLGNYGYTTPTYEPTTPDNPISGNQPFFSFVLNDYFQKNDDDPLTFKGVDWGKDFDYETSVHDDEYGKRNRRLPTSYIYTTETPPVISAHTQHSNADHLVALHGESSTEKGYSKKHEFDNHEKGNEQDSNHKAGYEHGGNNYRGFKDFIDTFANNFGSEGQNKDSKYVLKRNQDKGEKRKGFRRVYHKDEYQEDNEFYDNTNNSANAEEKGSTAAHAGGSHGLLQSHAVAALGNEANAFHKGDSTKNHGFEKNHKGHGAKKGLDSEFHRYRDVAKQAAQSNNADYIDHYKI